MAKCKWCGKPFKKTHNRQVYGTTGIHTFTITHPDGSTETTNCKKEARRWQNKTHRNKYYYKTNEYQNLLYKPNNTLLGTTNTNIQHRNTDFKIEYQEIQRELRRLGLKPNTTNNKYKKI